MASLKKSFISSFIGRETYDLLKHFLLIIIAVRSCVLAFMFLMSFFFLGEFISRLLHIVTGTSLLFLLFIFSAIIALDKEVVVSHSFYVSLEQTLLKTIAYKLTIIGGVLLIVLWMPAIIFSNRYAKQYAFDCSTILVDNKTGIYQYGWIDNCEIASDSEGLMEINGFEKRDELQGILMVYGIRRRS